MPRPSKKKTPPAPASTSKSRKKRSAAAGAVPTLTEPRASRSRTRAGVSVPAASVSPAPPPAKASSSSSSVSPPSAVAPKITALSRETTSPSLEAPAATSLPNKKKRTKKQSNWKKKKARKAAAAAASAAGPPSSAPIVVAPPPTPADILPPQAVGHDTLVVQEYENTSRAAGGFIFICNRKTKKECFDRRILGLPRGKSDVVEKIRTGALLFMYDVDRKTLHGVYRATSDGGCDLEPQAFGGKFSAQVRFKIDNDYPPLAESVFKQAVAENGRIKKLIRPMLTPQQVDRLLSLFVSTPANSKQIASQIVEDQCVPPDNVQQVLPPAAAPLAPAIFTSPSPAATPPAPVTPQPPPASPRAVVTPPPPPGGPLSPAVGYHTAMVHEEKTSGASGPPGGFIFFCNRKTKQECFNRLILGLPHKEAKMVDKIRAGAFLFMFDIDDKILHGVYRATSDGGFNLEPQALGGKFPAQVRFRIENDYPPLSENVFKQAMAENYRSKSRFRPVLSPQQVDKLLSLYGRTPMPTKPIPFEIIKDQHVPPQSLTPDGLQRSGQIYVPPPANPRYCSQQGRLPASDTYVVTTEAAHHIPVPSAIHPRANDQCNMVVPPSDSYYQRGHSRPHYPENPIPNERVIGSAMDPRGRLPFPTQHTYLMPRYQDPNRIVASGMDPRGWLPFPTQNSYLRPYYQDPNRVEGSQIINPRESLSCPTQPSYLIPYCPDPNRSDANRSQRPALNVANVPEGPGQLKCCCGNATPAYLS